MFIEDSSNVPNRSGIRNEALCSPIRRSAYLEGMPDPSCDFMLRETSWHQVCAVKSYMFRFCNRGCLLMCAMAIVRLRDGPMKLGEQIFVQLQDLRDVLLDGCSGLGR
jgi:hypothetical protein